MHPCRLKPGDWVRGVEAASLSGDPDVYTRKFSGLVVFVLDTTLRLNTVDGKPQENVYIPWVTSIDEVIFANP